uniref:CCHC-type domain-containing protein n=1 Tax=Photinus pyralis TaxID=7054 RepID=A0A1Y1NE45_PHOPY
MSFKLDVDRLSKDELEYELHVRDISQTGNVDQLRKCLRSVLLLEKSGKVVSQVVDLDSKLELGTCDTKITQIREAIQGSEVSLNQAKKIETKLAHIFARLDRILVEDETLAGKRSELMRKLMEAVSDYSNKYSLETLTNPAIPLDPAFNPPQTSASESTPTANLLSNDQIQTSTSSVKIVPVHKWNLKFSGSGKDGMSINAFLERVEDLCQSRNVSKSQLFDSAIDLFEGEALLWFRMIRKQVGNWKDLVTFMKQEFTPAHTSDLLWQQILKRTQGPKESTGIYVAVMTTLFDRMPVRVTDELRLKVLRANILPFYQERLGLVEIKTPFELIEYCRRLEAIKESVRLYKPPAKGDLPLEPDLECASGSNEKLSVREISVRNTAPSLCFRCNKPGHYARMCRVRTRLKCFSCGMDDVTKITCPKCNPQNSQSSNSGNDKRSQS